MFSKDEAYLAALVECVRLGTTDPNKLERPKIKAMLTSRPSLGSLISDGMQLTLWGGLDTSVDAVRVERILRKLALGHLKYELGETFRDQDARVFVSPLVCLSDEQKYAFENPSSPDLWPEIGSQALSAAAAEVFPSIDAVWWEIQESRYRYLVNYIEWIGVRIVLSEYLAAEIIFHDF